MFAMLGTPLGRTPIRDKQNLENSGVGRIAGKQTPRQTHPSDLLDLKPIYATDLGGAYVGDGLELLKLLQPRSVQAIITSPPYALHFKKTYGNPNQADYIDWFLGYAPEFRRVLKPKGSLVIEIGGAWNPGEPTRSIYHFELLVRLVKEAGFYLAEEFFWFNRARMPSPAEWVNVQRIRVKDAVTPIWWLSVSTNPTANNRRVLKSYSPEMLRLLEKGYNSGKRPSGHVARKFQRDNGGSIPPNLIEVAHTTSNDGYQHYCRKFGLAAHPARFPRQVPDFFLRFLTKKGDLVVDPFCGSNMTGYIAEKLGRRWLAFDREREYVRASLGRFISDEEIASNLIQSRRLQQDHKAC